MEKLELSLLGTAIVIFTLVVITALLPTTQSFDLERDTRERADLAWIARNATMDTCIKMVLEKAAVQCPRKSWGPPILLISGEGLVF
jgi:hypothetical protein